MQDIYWLDLDNILTNHPKGLALFVIIWIASTIMIAGLRELINYLKKRFRSKIKQ